MADEGGDIICRCRRCGEIDKSLHAPDVHHYLLDATRDGMPHTVSYVFRTHLCKDGHMGVLDLIGGEYDVPKR